MTAPLTIILSMWTYVLILHCLAYVVWYNRLSEHGQCHRTANHLLFMNGVTKLNTIAMKKVELWMKSNLELIKWGFGELGDEYEHG